MTKVVETPSPPQSLNIAMNANSFGLFLKQHIKCGGEGGMYTVIACRPYPARELARACSQANTELMTERPNKLSLIVVSETGPEHS